MGQYQIMTLLLILFLGIAPRSALAQTPSDFLDLSAELPADQAEFTAQQPRLLNVGLAAEDNSSDDAMVCTTKNFHRPNFKNELMPTDIAPELPDEVKDLIPLIPNPPVTELHVAGGASGLDPINLIFIGSQSEIRRSLQKARWSLMPTRMPSALLLIPLKVFEGDIGTSFPPMTKQFVRFSSDGQKEQSQNLSFARVHHKTHILRRHHFRLWRMPRRTADGREAWIGMANYDNGLMHTMHHRINPCIDRERDFIRDQLRDIGVVNRFAYTTLPGAISSDCRDANLPTNQDKLAYCTNGRTLIVEFKALGLFWPVTKPHTHNEP